MRGELHQIVDRPRSDRDRDRVLLRQLRFNDFDAVPVRFELLEHEQIARQPFIVTDFNQVIKSLKYKYIEMDDMRAIAAGCSSGPIERVPPLPSKLLSFMCYITYRPIL